MVDSESNSKRKYTHQSFIVNPVFQLRLIGAGVLMAGIVIAVFYGANTFFFYKFTEIAHQTGLPKEHIFFQFIDGQVQIMNLVFGMTASVTFALLFVSTVILSHRIAGPLYRLNTHMNDVAAGKTREYISFRRNDYFPELAEAYNKQLEALKKGDLSA